MEGKDVKKQGITYIALIMWIYVDINLETSIKIKILLDVVF